MQTADPSWKSGILLWNFFIPTAQELDVVYEEDIDIAVTAAETFRVLVLDTLDEFVDEVFTGDAQQAHVGEVL